MAHDLRNDWERQKADLQVQRDMLVSGEMRTGDKVGDSTTAETLARVEKNIAELNSLLAGKN